MVRRLLLIALLLTPLTFLAVGQVQALDPLQGVCKTDPTGKPDPNNPPICTDNRSGSGSKDPLFGPDGVLALALNVVSFIAGTLAIFAIIIAAIRMVTSVGDSKTITETRNSILFAVAGLIIVAVAQLIVRFILGRVKV